MPARSHSTEPSGRRTPKYLAIAADLEARIRSGEYPAGSALPAQRALSAAYGVTLMTLRQALEVLTDRGLVVSHAGRMTLVASPQANYRLDTLRSFTEDLREQGHDVTTVVCDVGLRRPPSWVAGWLGAGRALRLERLRRIDGQAAIQQESWVPMPYAESLRERDFSHESLYHALAGVGVAVERATERIRPGALDAKVAALLGRPAATPTWESLRVTESFTGAYVVVDRAVIVGDLVEIYTERSAQGVMLRWGQSGSPHDPRSGTATGTPHSATATRTAKAANTVPIR
ncbi:GntR family transcriptional regulator [Solwaraspora sp. WMMD406]|uniref:GntR family transcriptional regulator n=1 Tax=Solwaraspora sp. WMMD406 TaxID=3016095 RepID=UPI002415CE00|nr:GntR family transcriptional regulator [Solwaraspora sp. WMMD406]MDG4767448.1 GntR family transcriptional regulator [Solwaraspora sp. WMMD406]